MQMKNFENNDSHAFTYVDVGSLYHIIEYYTILHPARLQLIFGHTVKLWNGPVIYRPA